MSSSIPNFSFTKSVIMLSLSSHVSLVSSWNPSKRRLFRQLAYLECNGLVEISALVLGTILEYVIFGYFTSDPLEKQFGNLRHGSGGTYFIKVEQSLENVQHIK